MAAHPARKDVQHWFHRYKEVISFRRRSWPMYVLVSLSVATLLFLLTRSLPCGSTARSALLLKKVACTGSGGLDAAISGVTGNIFKGSSVRTYTGPLLNCCLVLGMQAYPVALAEQQEQPTEGSTAATGQW
jgi:hypothetical protein